jgi:hypothetical protein
MTCQESHPSDQNPFLFHLQPSPPEKQTTYELSEE